MTGKWQKAKRKITSVILNKIAGTSFQFSIYPSYRHYKRAGKKSASSNTKTAGTNWYLAQKPNYSAGIGHQLANWNTGYYFAGFYGLKFAHFPFSNNQWESLLGLGEKEMPAESLLRDNTYKKVSLPRFDSENKEQVTLIGNIIRSYTSDKILFILAQDQGYMRQCDTVKALSDKFFTAPARKNDNMLYTPGHFNIAIHIRRGDIVTMKQTGYSNWEERWLNNNYYVNILDKVLSVLSNKKNIQLYLFSQGTKEDFPELDRFSNLHYCLDTNMYDSFVNMAKADLLISSKSSFSYKPALFSKGIKICPGSFWHAYPTSNDFIIANDNGDFDEGLLRNAAV